MPTTERTAVAAARPAAAVWFAFLTTAVLALTTAVGHAAAPTEPGAEAHPDDVLVRLGDATVTRAAFEQEFEIAARTTALQQGLEPTPEVLAEFAAFRPMVLDQLATQLVLFEHARDAGVAAGETDVDEVIDQVRAAQEAAEGFDAYLTRTGFGDEATLRHVVLRSLSIQNVIELLAADVDVTDAEVEAWYDANPEMVQTPEGPLPLDAIRGEIAQLLVQERVDERVQELVAEAPLEVYEDRL